MGRIFFFYSLICFVLLSKSLSSSLPVHHPCSTSEAFALLQFKQLFEIYDESSWLCYVQTPFPKTMSWNESTDCCTWEGVTCDVLTGHVIGLDLSCSKLNGTIHQNSSLFQLHHLQTLNLAFNFFNWSVIPSDIGRLTDLRQLNLSGSSFGRKIPTEISYLSNLVSLDLSLSWCDLDQKTFETLLQNLTNLEVVSLSTVNISSPIPMNMSSSLRYVDLEATNLLGVFTESFFLLPKLERLKLGSNDLRGVLPKIKPSNTLLELDIANTGVYGRLPDSIGTFSSLNYLNLERCNFSGSIPDSLGNLTQIRELNFGENHFTGHIPSTISKLMQLTSLDLSSNSLTGDIPNAFSNFQKLVKLDLSKNIFTGPFPSSILSLGSLQSLELSSNSLSGPLPSNASMLQKLAYMELSHNSLNGTIPSWVFNIPSDNLMLDHNRFSRLDVADKLKTNPAVKVLDLSHNQLSGPVLRSLENLVNLFKLDLSSNNITENVGIEIFMTMQRLDYLDLSYNPLSWKSRKIAFPSLRVLLLSSCELEDFPYLLRNLKKLQILDLSNNKIHGPIPNWFSRMRWDSLQYLNVSLNSLTGHLELHQYNLRILDFKFNFLQGPIPSSICNMSSLEFLDLSRNNFSESIPNCFGSMAELLVLDLRKNNFSGSLPPLCTRSTSLRTIVLNGNQFEGHVPVSLLNCHRLEVLDVGNNAINDTFPAWLGTLQMLQVLIFKSNRFHGPLSPCQTNFCFPMLRIFDLSLNQFSGSLHAKVFDNFISMTKLYGSDKDEIEYMELHNVGIYDIMYKDSVRLVIKGQDIELERITTIMTAIDLSSNHFEGVIPKTLKDLGSLWLLNLSHNNLRGDIPTELGQLNMLEVLDLSWNRLTGNIPRELTRLNFLADLNLSQNRLVGLIPQGLQFNTFSNDSYVGNLDLCGPPLSKQCGASDQPFESEEEEEDESYFASGFTWESVVIGYSCGLVVGTVVCSFMFKAGKPKWFVEFFEGIIPNKKRRPKKRNQRRRT